MYNADTTPKAPRLCTYIESTLVQRTTESSEANEGCIQYTSWGVPVALFLTTFVRTARFLHCQNQSVQLRLICIYVCPTSAHRGFRYGYRQYKDNNFTSESVLFGWQNVILPHDLTLLNINMSKISTFAWFFSLKSLYSQWLFVSLHRQFPPSLSTMLKCVGLFCIYTFTLKIR